MFPRVLLPVDFSRHADRTIRCIVGIPGIRELLLHVLEDGGAPARGPHSIEPRIRESMGRPGYSKFSILLFSIRLLTPRRSVSCPMM